MKRDLIAAGLLVTLALAGGCSTPPSGTSPDASVELPKNRAECLAAAQRQLEADKQSGVAEAEAVRRYALIVQRCTTPTWSREKNVLAAAINEDYRRSAGELLDKRMPPRAYLDLRRDRARKYALAAKDPSWAAELAAGDADGDLVPDQRDACPGTPPLTATDAKGCPATRPPEKTPEECAPLLQAWQQGAGSTPPYECLVYQAIDEARVTWHPKCAGAPPPSTPVQLVVYPAAQGFYLLTQVKNQPEGCPVLYEVEVACIYSSPTRPPWYEKEIFSHTADQDPGAGAVRFAVGTGHPTPGLVHAIDVEFDRTYRWRARAINGNGQKSGWSDWQGKFCPNHSLCKP